MSTLSQTDLLDVWEQAQDHSSMRGALLLLAAASPPRTVDEWAQASVGERDRELIRLRADLFGQRFEAVATCPACNAMLDVSFNAADILVPAAGRTREPLRLESSGYKVEFRLPSTADLLALLEGDAALTEQALLARCTEQVTRDEAEVPIDAVPGEVLACMKEEMARSDPQAEVEFELQCPSCEHKWPLLFDIVRYLWSELEDCALRLLRDVHRLASAYGWSEQAILTMSPRRRRSYLELIEA